MKPRHETITWHPRWALPVFAALIAPLPAGAARHIDHASEYAACTALVKRDPHRGCHVIVSYLGTKLYLSLAHDAAVCDAFLDRFNDAGQGRAVVTRSAPTYATACAGYWRAARSRLR